MLMASCSRGRELSGLTSSASALLSSLVSDGERCSRAWGGYERGGPVDTSDVNEVVSKEEKQDTNHFGENAGESALPSEEHRAKSQPLEHLDHDLHGSLLTHRDRNLSEGREHMSTISSRAEARRTHLIDPILQADPAPLLLYMRLLEANT